MKCVICEEETEKRCSRCKLIGYCSVAHQKLDWNNHKILCKTTTENSSRECHAVFSNNVVWKDLSSYLNFADLKAARLTCRIFNEKILSETNFKQRAVIKLTSTDLTPQHFGQTKEFWNSFKITLSLPEEKDEDNLDWLYQLLKGTRSLHLTCDSQFDYKKFFSVDQPSLIKLLCCSESLRNFGISSSLLLKILDSAKDNTTYLDKLLSSSEVVKTLDSIQEFQVLLNLDEFQSGPSHEYKISEDSIKKLVGRMKNLRTIIVDDLSIKIRRLQCSPQLDKVQMELSKFLCELIEINQSHLGRIQCDHLVPQFLSLKKEEKMERKFPLLKALSIYNLKDDWGDGSIVEFLNGPHLEEIDLSTSLCPLSNTLWNVIREKSSNLKRLFVKMTKFSEEEENLFNFLRDLKHLQEFQLDISTFFYSNNAHLPSLGDILLKLPGNTIQKLSINGVPYFNPNDHLTSGFFQNFVNPLQLTVLTLNRYECAITDDTLEFIFKNFKMLQKFELSESLLCTDYGFTGIKGSKKVVPEFSIKELKGLKSLMIRDCANITNEACKAIVFLELQRLDISRNDGIDAEGINVIFKNNPSLEYLKISHLPSNGDEKLFGSRPSRFKVLDFPARSDRDSQLSLDEADLENSIDGLF